MKKKPLSKKVNKSAEDKKISESPLYIVGIGASAGGLEAFSELLKNLPANTGMAFILVQHLDPNHESMLTELLRQETTMNVSEVKNKMKIMANHVYVIPPSCEMTVSKGLLYICPRKKTSGKYMPVDTFFTSLASDQKNRAIGIILSGTATDGTIGLRNIKSEGGLTFAQDEKTAKFDGMPRSAISAGVVDFILSPEDIAGEIAQIDSYPYITGEDKVKTHKFIKEDEKDMTEIFRLLKQYREVDFTYYKPSTIRRRLARRMILCRIKHINDYIRYLKETPSELDFLYQDFLINVTGFFREPETFETLRKKIFPEILSWERDSDMPVRIWVPGCSTGEEAYSIAIYMIEYLQDINSGISASIFATDINEMAIEKARTGFYPETAVSDIPPDKLRKFFVKTEHGYQINKTVRNSCIFARHDLIKDPPFSNIDLISCRNVMIYLGPVLQKKIIPAFHYALNTKGFLMLGTSETIGTYADLFSLEDKRYKIYSKKSIMSRRLLSYDFPVEKYNLKQPDMQEKSDENHKDFNILKEADRVVLSTYAPPGILVDENMDIIEFRRNVSPYLKPASGPASLNLMKMAHEDLLVELRIGIHKSKQENSAITKTGLSLKYNGTKRTVDIKIIPLKKTATAKEYYFLILFYEKELIRPEEQKTGKKTEEPGEEETKEKDRKIIKLQEELKATREYLQSIIEEREATNEELRSAIEEIQSSNEELQSTNEEMETAKEELQSTNEELTTVNEELQHRNMELTQLNNDLTNLLSSVNIPVIILSSDLRIRRFTPLAEKIWPLIPSDTGRPLADLNLNILIPDIEKRILNVIDSLTSEEMEVQDREGRWYYLRIRPYKTLDNKIDGVIISMMDIDTLKKSSDLIKEAQEYAEAIVESIKEPLIILTADLKIKSANRSFYETFNITPSDTEEKYIYNLNSIWNNDALVKLLEELLPGQTHFENFIVEQDVPLRGKKKFSLNGRCIRNKDKSSRFILMQATEIIE
ncbi:MAG: chemotaxis protein CheB [Candidatus Eremiobacterota bacterium]